MSSGAGGVNPILPHLQAESESLGGSVTPPPQQAKSRVEIGIWSSKPESDPVSLNRAAQITTLWPILTFS